MTGSTSLCAAASGQHWLQASHLRRRNDEPNRPFARPLESQDANLESDETLAQLLDRGEMTVWRELYRLARTDVQLRRRIERIVLNIPLTMPHLWLAAL